MKKILNCYIGNVCPSDAEPTDAAIEYGCDACEYIKDNKIQGCTSFVFMAGRAPDGETYKDIGKCTQAWESILLVENAMTNRGQTQALESFRNETVKRQDVMIEKAERPLVAVPPKLING